MSSKLKKVINILFNVLRHPGVSYYYVQKGIRLLFIRRALASLLRMFIPKSKSIDSNLELSTMLGQLHSDGYWLREGFITQEQIREIREFLKGKDCVDYSLDVANRYPGKFKVPEQVPPNCLKAKFDLKDVLECPHLLSIANDPRILKSVEGILGCKPTITVIHAWWSFYKNRPQSRSLNAEYIDNMFHRDVEDYNFVTLFLYLSDVDEGAGPHVYVKGSVDSTKLTKRAPLTDEEVIEAFGKENIMTFCGGAGTAILERTFGVHRASPLTHRDRLMFSVNYCLTGMTLDAARKPCQMRNHPYDPYINRIYLKG